MQDTIECKFKVGDRVLLNGNPHDEQLGEGGVYGYHIVTKIKKVPNNYWVKTNKERDWIDQNWYDLATEGIL